MIELKCPFCQQELEIWHTNRVRMYACPDLTCKGYYMSATKDMWQELIRTRKALEIAVDALKNMNEIIKNYEYGNGLYYALDGHDTMLIAEYVEKALDQITAEQKDVK